MFNVIDVDFIKAQSDNYATFVISGPAGPLDKAYQFYDYLTTGKEPCLEVIYATTPTITTQPVSIITSTAATGGTISGDTISVTVNHFTKYAVLTAHAASLPETQGSELTDIEDHWAEDAIRKLVDYESGYTDGTFKPYQTITRAKFIVIL